jgi:hypothetical protein
MALNLTWLNTARWFLGYAKAALTDYGEDAPIIIYGGLN